MKQNTLLFIALCFGALLVFSATARFNNKRKWNHGSYSSSGSGYGGNTNKNSNNNNSNYGNNNSKSGQSSTASIIQSLLLAPSAGARINILNKDSDFTFNFLQTAQNTPPAGKGGNLILADRTSFPAAIGNGASMAIGYLGPCGMFTPHTHPRATEFTYVVNGTLLTGFVLENGARQVTNTVSGGSAVIFPKGSIHWIANLGCEPSVFVASLNDEDPGLSSIAQNFFGIEEDVVSATLGGVNSEYLSQISSQLPPGLILGLETCLQKCGLEQSSSSGSSNYGNNGNRYGSNSGSSNSGSNCETSGNC